jgi:hypothetical protein
MKKLILLLTFPFCIGQAVTQDCWSYDWATVVGGTELETSSKIALDDLGNSYVTGLFTGTATFGSTILTSNAGSRDIFIAKANSSGQFLWAKQIGGNTLNDDGNDIAVDALGNVYVTGIFAGTASFGSTTFTSSGNRDAFITKLDTEGEFLWAKQIGGISINDFGQGIAVDASGNSYVTGCFQGTATFGSTTLTSFGNEVTFITKLDADGEFLWTTEISGTGTVDSGLDIAIDGAGDSYVTGYFYGTATFGSTTLTSAGEYDIFIAKLDASGNFLWAKQAGGSGYDYGFGVAVDAFYNSYLTGIFEGTATFGSTTLTSAGSADVFIAKLDDNGDFLWAEQVGGSGYESGYSIAIDGSGKIYVVGDFNGTVTLGSTTLTGYGGFIVNLDADGSFLWIKKAGYSVDGIAIDASGNIMVTGTVGDPFTLGNITLTSSGSLDVFIAKLSNVPPVTAILDAQENIICNGNSNGSATVSASGGTSPYSYSWSPSGGNTETANNLAAGTYICTITDINSCNTTQEITITEPDELIANISSQTDVTCHGNSDGAITISVDGGISPYSYSWSPEGGNTATADNLSGGNYTCTITDANFCSTFQDVTISEPDDIDATTALNGIIITANTNSATYQWIDCDNGNQPIVNEINQSFTATSNGNYAVEITVNGCAKTSDCVTIATVGIEIPDQKEWKIYPNPNDGIFTITSPYGLDNTSIDIYSGVGQLMYQIENASGTGMAIDLKSYPEGVYLVHLNKTTVFKVITSKMYE